MCVQTLTIFLSSISFSISLFYEEFHCLTYKATKIALYGIMEGIAVRDLEFWGSVQAHTKMSITNLVLIHI